MRQRAVDLLYAMCDRTNAEEIVGEMLSYLETADYSIREEMVRLVLIYYGGICALYTVIGVSRGVRMIDVESSVSRMINILDVMPVSEYLIIIVWYLLESLLFS